MDHMHQALHVIVAAVAAWLLGALWYSPVMFAKAWVRAHGYSEEQVKAMRATQSRVIGLTLVALILMTAVLQVFLNHLGADSLNDGVQWGFHAWLGFAVPLGFIAHLYAQKKWAAWFIDLGYQLVYIVVIAAILASWR
jgi:hypothetical protein